MIRVLEYTSVPSSGGSATIPPVTATKSTMGKRGKRLKGKRGKRRKRKVPVAKDPAPMSPTNNVFALPTCKEGEIVCYQGLVDSGLNCILNTCVRDPSALAAAPGPAIPAGFIPSTPAVVTHPAAAGSPTCGPDEFLCTKQLQAAGVDCRLDQCEKAEVDVEAVQQQVAAFQHEAEQMVVDLFLACPQTRCALPRASQPDYSDLLRQSLQCLAQEDHILASRECLAALEPVRSYQQAGQQQAEKANELYDLISEACPSIPCVLPTNTERAAVDEAMQCFRQLSYDGLSETCKPVLGPLLQPGRVGVDTSRLGTKQSRSILAKFNTLKPFCPSITCDTAPSTEAALEDSLACLNRITLSQLSPECREALTQSARQHAPPQAASFAQDSPQRPPLYTYTPYTSPQAGR